MRKLNWLFLLFLWIIFLCVITCKCITCCGRKILLLDSEYQNKYEFFGLYKDKRYRLLDFYVEDNQKVEKKYSNMHTYQYTM